MVSPSSSHWLVWNAAIVVAVDTILNREKAFQFIANWLIGQLSTDNEIIWIWIYYKLELLFLF